jgi:hypothetical protein
MENVKKSRQIIRNRQLQRRIVVKLMADKTQEKYIIIKNDNGVLRLVYKGINKNFVSSSVLTKEKQNFQHFCFFYINGFLTTRAAQNTTCRQKWLEFSCVMLLV